MTYMVTPQHKNHCPGCHEIDIFGSPVLDIITIYLILSEPYPRVKMMIFLRHKLLTPKLNPHGVGVTKYTISCLPTLQILLTKFVKKKVLEKNKRTTDDDECQWK